MHVPAVCSVLWVQVGYAACYEEVVKELPETEPEGAPPRRSGSAGIWATKRPSRPLTPAITAGLPFPTEIPSSLLSPLSLAAARAAALALLADAYLAIGDAERAVASFEGALKLTPKDVALRSKIGRALVQTHDYKRAYEYYEVPSRGADSHRSPCPHACRFRGPQPRLRNLVRPCPRSAERLSVCSSVSACPQNALRMDHSRMELRLELADLYVRLRMFCAGAPHSPTVIDSHPQTPVKHPTRTRRESRRTPTWPVRTPLTSPAPARLQRFGLS